MFYYCWILNLTPTLMLLQALSKGFLKEYHLLLSTGQLKAAFHVMLLIILASSTEKSSLL